MLVVATGARLLPEETEGLTGPGWMEKVFTFYTLRAPSPCSTRWSGSPAAGSSSTSSTCRSSARSRRWSSASWPTATSGSAASATAVELTYVTPLDGAFTKPVCNRELGGLLASKGIELVTEFNTGRGRRRGRRRLVSYDGREVPFDLAVVVPLHGGPAYVGRSPGLGDELGFVPVDPHTLQSKARPNVFVIGDAADMPPSKAGSVAHFEGEVLAGNVRRFLAGRAAGRRLRRAHQLLHRDRLRQGPADRLQLRHRAADRPLPRPGSACRCCASPG